MLQTWQNPKCHTKTQKNELGPALETRNSFNGLSEEASDANDEHYDEHYDDELPLLKSPTDSESNLYAFRALHIKIFRSVPPFPVPYRQHVWIEYYGT